MYNHGHCRESLPCSHRTGTLTPTGKVAVPSADCLPRSWARSRPGRDMLRPHSDVWVHLSCRLQTSDCQSPEGGSQGWLGDRLWGLKNPIPFCGPGRQGGPRLPTLGPGLSSLALDPPVFTYSACQPQVVPALHFQGCSLPQGCLPRCMCSWLWMGAR